MVMTDGGGNVAVGCRVCGVLDGGCAVGDTVRVADAVAMDDAALEHPAMKSNPMAIQTMGILMP
ncbi:MAG: hypothetical protein D6737_06825 [Chloroflexi bacterium]|nr:MAG: hypothetical protein D6737_06825 [Chloroflexota bacterium]